MTTLDLNESQRKAFNSLINKKTGIFLIKGAAGTGKTFLASEIIKFFMDNDKTVMGLSPTHQAAAQLRKNLVGYLDKDIKINTVASFLKVQKKIDPITGKQFFNEGENNIKTSYNLIIVDEASMINEAQLRKIYLAARYSLVIVLGDYEQLKPVAGNTSESFFKPYQIYTLDKIERYDGNILGYCNNLRNNICYPTISNEINIISGFNNTFNEVYNHIQNNSNPDSIGYLAFTNNEVKKMRNALQIELYGNYDFNIGQYIRLETPTEHSFNGDLNIITDVNHKQILLFDNMIFNAYDLVIQNIHTGISETITTVNYDDRDFIEDALKSLYSLAEEKYNIYNSILDKKSYNFKVCKYDWVDVIQMVKTTFNLSLVTCPYSSTIHKAQGRTIENVYVNISDIMKYGRTMKKNLMYVAASRTSKKLTVVKDI